MTERADLYELVRRAGEISNDIGVLFDELRAAYDAALGEYDEETETEIRPGSGDDFNLLEKAKDTASRGRFTMGELQGLLATQQGLRDFADAGVVEPA